MPHPIFQFSIFNFQLLAFLLLISCSAPTDQKKKSATAPVQSALYELLIVANKDWLQTPPGATLMDVVESEVIGLPQYEPSFRTTKINPTSWDGTFRMYGINIVAEVGSKYPKAEMRISRDIYCRPQLIIFLTAPDNQSFVQLTESRKSQILDLLNEHEFARQRTTLNKKYSKLIDRQTRRQFSMSIHAPSEISKLKTGHNFLWASDSEGEFKQNLCIYTLPLRSLTPETFTLARDSVMRINIPGGRPDQWMETEAPSVTMALPSPQTSGTAALRATHPLLIFRGLWSMRHDAMGGPFISYVYKDEDRQCLLVAEAFVFAPGQKKRPLIRQMEAALQTLSFLPNTR